MFTSHSGWNAASAPCVCSNPSLRLHPLRPQQVLNCIFGARSVIPLCSLPCLFSCAHVQMPQCKDLSVVFVFLAGNPSLNYSCPTCCNFKGRNLDVFHVTIMPSEGFYFWSSLFHFIDLCAFFLLVLGCFDYYNLVV